MTGDVKGVDLEQVSVTSGPSTVNVYNNDEKRRKHSSTTLEQRVERLERATFGDDVIGLYGVIRQQQRQTRWLQILTVAVAVSEILRLYTG